MEPQESVTSLSLVARQKMNIQPSEDGSNDHEEGASSPRAPKRHKCAEGASAGGGLFDAPRDDDEGGDDEKGDETHISDKVANVDETVIEEAGGCSKTEYSIPTTARADRNLDAFDPPVLRKGDLVRLSNEQRSGRIQGGLARIIRVTALPPDEDECADNGPFMYGIEYVLGGRLFNLTRCDLNYTTATAEGLVDASNNSGHLLRRRRVVAVADGETQVRELHEGGVKESRETTTRVDTSPSNRKPGRPPGSKNKSGTPEEGLAEGIANEKSSMKVRERKTEVTSSKKRHRSSKTSEDESNGGIFELRSQASKAGWETRRAQASAANATTKPASKPAACKRVSCGFSGSGSANKSASNRSYKRSHTVDTSESDATSTIAPIVEDSAKSHRVTLYSKHRKELEKSLVRLEKLDRFGFFFEATPPQFDENYDVGDGDIPGNGDSSAQAAQKLRKAVPFPDQPPHNFLVVRKRLAAGMYDTDMVALELMRLKEIKAMMNTSETSHNESEAENMNYDIEYDELEKSIRHPIAVDWDTFNADVVAMCDAAICRDPVGISLGPGHLGWAANKIKKVMEEMYNTYGNKRRSEVEENEARGKYDQVLMSCGNMEAAVQGKWRKQAFPERKYERLETSSVICDGLSPNDRSYAMYELETKLPDSFVGLAYTYDDSGQHSETWMQTVADETSQTKPQKTKVKKKKKEAKDESDSLALNNETTAQRAAMALAKDDGVVRAQVQTTMATLLIQVQDRVMTDLGVMHSPEARSANWDDGDHGRNYRGGGAEVEQGTHSGYSLPEVAEQEVWGIDCYTRKNIMTLIESEFSSEIAVEFVEKWLLPAINACPVDLAHKMSIAARILEGLEIFPNVERNSALHDEATPSAEHAECTSEDLSIPSDPKATSQSVFLRHALESKIREHAPPWIKAVARLVRLASDSMDDDIFRIHPKGHGSVVIGEGGLRANSLVTYYRGEVYPAWRWCEKLDAIEHVQRELNLRPNLPDFYNMAMERPKKDPRGYCLLFVDASRKSGLGSSFSHSCNPTCEVRVVSLNGKLSLSMTTLRDLEQGEELTFDYNAVTESVNEYRFAVCLCGQKNCRGSFLHYATADCYQQVLSRNSPVAARFANLVRGCMKQVMSKEDSELLLKHGFNTASFGAVSFNHHVSSADPQSTPDSIENVPIWLRTFVADCLRYIEYERRALPVALLCNQMERSEKKEGKSKAPFPKKENTGTSIESASSKLKSVAGSKPVGSYFFFLQNRRETFAAIAKVKHGDLKGLEFNQAVNKIASQAWSNLTEEEKQLWKKKAIKDWKKKGGEDKAKLEEERQRTAKAKEAPKLTDKQKVEAKTKEGGEIKENGASSDHDETMEAKTISIADADAEGFSAMEQRIQQLAQSLSRVGRVLDRHRESVFAERKDHIATVDSDLLRNLVPSPLKIMSDEEVVSWIWSDSKGVIPNMFSMIDQYFLENSLLSRILCNTKNSFPVLSAFSQKFTSSNLDRKFKHSCTSSDARRLVKEALLKLRMNIIDFLSFAEKSSEDVRIEKRREKSRAKEAKKKQQKKSSALLPEGPHSESKLDAEDSMPLASDAGDIGSMETTTDVPSMHSSSSPPDDGGVSSDDNEAMAMRGGGGESAPTDPSTSNFDSLIDVNNNILLPPSTGAVIVQESFMDGATSGLTIVQSAVCEDVQSLLHLSQLSNNFGTPDPASSSSFQPCTDESTEMKEGGTPVGDSTHSSSKLQDLINAVASNEYGGVESNAEAITANTNPTFTLNGVLPSTFLPDGSLEQIKSEAETKKPKKKVEPLSAEQKKYLFDWLFDPTHVLNPYPTEEEKSTIMKDTGIERGRLDSWLMKNRQKVLNPEVQPVKMKWNEQDQDHWENFRTNRFMLEATADLLLMYAHTTTFFLLEPFRQFDSTPIEVYARELGNQVPRHFSLHCQKCPSPTPDVTNSNGGVLIEDSSCKVIEANSTKIFTKITTQEVDELCSPDDVIDKVTVGYAGEYVLSQLLQWVNGGIGQKKGLPDIYGCVMLPPIKGCWEEIKCSGVKLPNYRSHRTTATEYHAIARPKLAEWFADRYQRGSPWDQEVAKYLCPFDQTAPDPTMPMGSPVLDYLVTGNDANIRHVSASLSEHSSTTERGGTKISASDRLQVTVDEGMPAQAVANWVQCENPNCLKWRKLPWHVDVDLLPEAFFCKDNIWNPKSKNCDAPEDEWDMEDAPIKFDTHEELEIGAWFDVQREGKQGYHEAQVIGLDLESNTRRVKFHFWKLSSDRDEWVEIGSPRIAPHHSYTPRPLDGYGAKSKKSSDRKNVSNNQSLSLAASALPQKRKIDGVDVAVPIPSESADGDEQNKFVLFSKSTVDYLTAWMSQNAANPFPSTSEKAQIIADTGLNKRQISDWMARARRKLRVKSSKPSENLAKESVRLAPIPSTDVTGDKSLLSNKTNVENLLLELRNQPMLLQDSVLDNTLSALPASKAEAVQQGSYADVSAGKLGITSLITELESDKHETSRKKFELYMKKWRLRPENAETLYPSSAEKKMIAMETGIDKKRLDGWFFRARKKVKKRNIQPVIQSIVSQPSVLSATSDVIVKAESPNFGSSRAIQCEVLSLKKDPSHSLISMQVPSMQGSSANVSMLNSSIYACNTSASVLTGTTIAEQASLLPSATVASTESQNLSDSSNKALNANILTPTMEVAKGCDTIKSSLSSLPKGLTEYAKSYLSRWMSEHSLNPYPTREEKGAMMRHLGILDEKKLDGWFCRARKRQTKHGLSNNPDPKTASKDDRVNVGVKHQGNHTLQPPGHHAVRLNSISQTDQNLGSSCIASAQGLSNFASLLSAANLINAETGNAETVNASNQVRVHDDPMAHDREYSQQQTQQSPHATQHRLTPPDSERNRQSVGAKEQAIFATFQSLQSMEIRDRASYASPADHLPMQEPQQHVPSCHSSYHNPHVHQSSHAEYMHHPEYSECSDYSSYQYSQDRHSAYTTDHVSSRTSQVQERAHPAEYSYQYPQGQEGASPAECSYQIPLGQEQTSPVEYSYQYPQGQDRASFAEHPHYQYSGDPQLGQGYSFPPPHEEFSYGHHLESNGFYQQNIP